MRASETVSEASPGSTASQTGVPTQVVQQVQGTQQVRHAPPPGWTEALAVVTLLSPLPVLLLEPYAHLFLSRCSLLKKKSLPLHPASPHTGQASLEKPIWFRSFLLSPQRLLVQTSVQAKPGHVSPLQLTNIPVPQQVSAPPLAPPPLSESPQGVEPTPVACSDLPALASRMQGLP